MSQQNLPPLTDLAGLAGLGGAPVQATYPTPANVVTTTFDDESISTSDFPIYKGQKANADRIGILMPGAVTFGRVHYVEHGEKKGYFLCGSTFSNKNGQEIPTRIAPCCEKLDAPSKRFAVPIIHYATDANGAVVSPFSFQLKVWRFTEKIYVGLRGMHKEFPLGAHDLLLRCEDEQYQRITYTPCREAIHTRPEFKAQYAPMVEGFLASLAGRLERAVGRRADAKEWAELLGAAVPAGVGAVIGGGAQDPPVDIGELLRGPA